jgi:hypothetical protein
VLQGRYGREIPITHTALVTASAALPPASRPVLSPSREGGTEPDLLEEVAYWQTDDFWQYAMYAAVACIRAAASRAGVPVRQACQDLNERPGHQAPCRIGAREPSGARGTRDAHIRSWDPIGLSVAGCDEADPG